MSRAEREKGKRGERQACELLKSLGYEAARSVQYCGRSETSEDLRHSVPGVRLEVKHGYSDATEADKRGWLSKLETERTAGEVAVVLWRPDRKAWRMLWRLSPEVVVETTDIGAALSLFAQK